TVAEKSEDAVASPVVFGRQGHAAGDRQAMTKSSGRGLDAGHTRVSHMSSKQRAILVEIIKARQWEEARLCEDRIEPGAAVALAEDEPVTPRPAGTMRIDTQRTSVKHRQELCGRQRRSNVRGSASVRHCEHVAPYPPCQRLAAREIQRHSMMA